VKFKGRCSGWPSSPRSSQPADIIERVGKYNDEQSGVSTTTSTRLVWQLNYMLGRYK